MEAEYPVHSDYQRRGLGRCFRRHKPRRNRNPFRPLPQPFSRLWLLPPGTAGTHDGASAGIRRSCGSFLPQPPAPAPVQPEPAAQPQPVSPQADLPIDPATAVSTDTLQFKVLNRFPNGLNKPETRLPVEVNPSDSMEAKELEVEAIDPASSESSKIHQFYF